MIGKDQAPATAESDRVRNREAAAGDQVIQIGSVFTISATEPELATVYSHVPGRRSRETRCGAVLCDGQLHPFGEPSAFHTGQENEYVIFSGHRREHIRGSA